MAADISHGCSGTAAESRLAGLPTPIAQQKSIYLIDAQICAAPPVSAEQAIARNERWRASV
ncbi:hypothetical protein RSP673_010860 [Ralstonia solanacearum P673]|uniref:Uncharacterized protein n=1 Tax=Ralstonia solanacearum (strain Po82) TaxID=1031711 RepID=F6G188_RALS8|nr:hypothetical protein [Ralstonia solanacearum]AEG68892.1 hypothetical protein RSPO_c01592 [Ralstonia solanacearum Po82]MBB6587999.1 hypothetical protein [Ralstonia solanacearum]MCG3576574.1 hypothetical protein [Ralstonia solanacearum]MCL9828165.1 hypothetical protein [Ralstonia solanacearum]MCL9832937.1 hypothetical protein [Ralstonia solanacearum]